MSPTCIHVYCVCVCVRERDPTWLIISTSSLSPKSTCLSLHVVCVCVCVCCFRLTNNGWFIRLHIFTLWSGCVCVWVCVRERERRPYDAKPRIFILLQWIPRVFLIFFLLSLPFSHFSLSLPLLCPSKETIERKANRHSGGSSYTHSNTRAHTHTHTHIRRHTLSAAKGVFVGTTYLVWFLEFVSCVCVHDYESVCCVCMYEYT